jgi:hypothetical protein
LTQVIVRYADRTEPAVNLSPGTPLSLHVEGEETASMFFDVNGALHLDVFRRKSVAPPEIATSCYATSTIDMRYGCGHVLTVINGDLIWPACPWCTPTYRALWGDRPEPRKLAAV